MDFAFLLIFVFVAIFITLSLVYVVRSLRALHIKVGKHSDRLTSANQKIIAESRNSFIQNYRQLEAFIQLNSLIKLSAPLPSTRGWAASPDLLLTLAHLVQSNKPKMVVELGSGISTVVMSKAGAKKIISFDGSEEYSRQTRELLLAHGAKGVEVRFAKLAPFENSTAWYDVNAFKDLKKIDLLVIDGPQGGDDANARYPAIKVLLSKLSPKAIIVLDDVKRVGEKKLADDFAAALPNHELEILDHEKGTAIIRPKK